MGIRHKNQELSDRLLDFTVSIIKLVRKLPRDMTGNHLSLKLLRFGTSPGVYYEQARSAESKVDFILKLGTILEELKESRYWLKVIEKASLMQPDRICPLLNECEALMAIISKGIFTAKKAKNIKQV